MHEDKVDDVIIDDEVLEVPELVEVPEESKPTPRLKVRKKHMVSQEFSVNAPEQLTSGDEISLPSNFDKETRLTLEKTPNVNLMDNPDAREWASVLSDGLELSTFGETYVETLEDESSEFKQHMEENGTSLDAKAPKFKNIENQNLKGERAVIRFISHLGLGTLFQVPLWHSGLWITFKPAAEAEIIELNRQLISDKISFGRHTYGLSFSNTSAYTTNRLVEFALAHVYDISAKSEDVTVSNIKEHISCQDIPLLLWGFICTMYPKGFKYRRACIEDPEKCNHVLEDTLNVTKLQWTNVNALSDWQMTYMSNRQSKCKSLVEINRYQEELSTTNKKKFVLNEGKPNEVTLTIKTPTVTEHVESGYKWISDIVVNVDNTLGKDISDTERNDYIIKHGQASAMRQYGHWVESIEYGTNIIDDRETIDHTLDIISQDDAVRTDFTDKVVKYINESTVSIVGIPVFDCPSCGTNQAEESNENFTSIIPLDVIQLFFALLTQRLERLTDR